MRRLPNIDRDAVKSLSREWEEKGLAYWGTLRANEKALVYPPDDKVALVLLSRDMSEVMSSLRAARQVLEKAPWDRQHPRITRRDQQQAFALASYHENALERSCFLHAVEVAMSRGKTLSGVYLDVCLARQRFFTRDVPFLKYSTLMTAGQYQNALAMAVGFNMARITLNPSLWKALKAEYGGTDLRGKLRDDMLTSVSLLPGNHVHSLTIDGQSTVVESLLPIAPVTNEAITAFNRLGNSKWVLEQFPSLKADVLHDDIVESQADPSSQDDFDAILQREERLTQHRNLLADVPLRGHGGKIHYLRKLLEHLQSVPYPEDQSYKEIAAALGWTEGAVKSAMSRLRNNYKRPNL